MYRIVLFLFLYGINLEIIDELTILIMNHIFSRYIETSRIKPVFPSRLLLTIEKKRKYQIKLSDT